MNNKKINIIHPKDDTTDFLEEIYSYIKINTGVEINLLRLESKEDHVEFFKLIHLFPNDELVLFLGHGTSTCLSGASTKEYELIEFISEKQLKVFEEKKVILLACRSDQYLKVFFENCNIKSAIGFPNLITDLNEVEYYHNSERLSNIIQGDIDIFKIAIVDVIKYSLEDFINNNLSFYQLFNRIKLRINKRVVKFYNTTPNKGKLPLGEMLNDMAIGLDYFEKRY